MTTSAATDYRPDHRWSLEEHTRQLDAAYAAGWHDALLAFTHSWMSGEPLPSKPPRPGAWAGR